MDSTLHVSIHCMSHRGHNNKRSHGHCKQVLGLIRLMIMLNSELFSKWRLNQTRLGLWSRTVIRIYSNGVIMTKTISTHVIPTLQGFLQPQFHGEYTLFEGRGENFLYHHGYEKGACNDHAYRKWQRYEIQGVLWWNLLLQYLMSWQS